MESKDLGPCPLCGMDAKPSGFDYDREQKYVYCICGLDVPMSVWNRLSALAAQNRRRGEALERCQEYFGNVVTDEHGEPIGEYDPDMRRMCEEALK